MPEKYIRINNNRKLRKAAIMAQHDLKREPWRLIEEGCAKII